jgi:tetratricopeptide (TPR) repeat protein
MNKKANLREKSVPEFYFALFMGLLSALAYSPALKGEFVWDDELYVSGNALLGNLSLQGLQEIFSTFVSGNYHPLTILSLALEFPFAGKSTFLFHLTNLILHGLNTALLWMLLAQKLSLPKPSVILITLLFGIHPMHTESVAWISERKDVLYGFFYLLALYTALDGNTPRHRGLMIVFFICSALSKAVAVTFPIVWMLAEAYRKPEGLLSILKKEALWIGLLLTLSLGTGILAIIAQDTSIRDYKIYTLTDNFFVGCYALLFYPIKTLLPIQLSAFYPYYEKTGALPPLPYLLSPVLLLGIAGLLWKLKTRVPELAQGALLYLALILPVAQFLPVGNAVAADRYAYLASWGIAWMLTAVLRLPIQSYLKPAGIVLTAGLFLMTWERSKVWLTTVSLWEDVIEKEESVPLAWYNLGNHYLDLKQPDKAIPYFEKARRFNPQTLLHPNYVHSWNNLANAKLQKKEYAEAENLYIKILEMDSLYTGAYVNLGNLYNESNQPDKAIGYFKKALSQQPGHTGIMINLALAYFKSNQFEAALQLYDELLQLQPRDATMHHQKGLCLASMNRFEEAKAEYFTSLNQDPNLLIAKMNLAVLMNQTGKSDSAILLLKEAAKSGYPGAQEALRSNGLSW